MFGKKTKIFVVLLFSVFLLFPKMERLQAAVKDSDLDGLTDQAETQVYQTDPTNPDTDGDGVPDGQEVLDGTNPADANDSLPADLQSQSAQPILHSESLPWYIGRASGIFSFLLLTVVVVNGLLISTRTVSKFIPPPLNFEMHRFFAWLSLFAILGHVASFTFDPFIHLSWLEGFVPFLLNRSMTSGLGYSLRIPVTMGIFALYGILTLVLTSHFRNKIGMKAWRRIHYVSFATYLLFLGHGIFSGTDTATWWMIWMYSFSAFLVGLLTIVRISTSVRKRRAERKAKSEDAFTGLVRPLPPPSKRKFI